MFVVQKHLAEVQQFLQFHFSFFFYKINIIILLKTNLQNKIPVLSVDLSALFLSTGTR